MSDEASATPALAETLAAAIQSQLERQLAAKPHLQSDNVAPPSTSLHAASSTALASLGFSLAREKAAEFIGKITGAIKVVEIDRALAIGQELEGWLPSHEHLLDRDLLAQLLMELANLAIVRARLDAPLGTQPDMSTANRYLSRARDVSTN